jgi:hypothetical protein
MLDLGAELDHEEPLPPSGKRSSAVALQDHPAPLWGTASLKIQ